jgi:hypothetical protein
MIRMTRNLGLAVGLLLIAPLSAQALGVASLSSTGSGGSNSLLLPGETITFDIVMENNSYEDVFGFGVGARGYDQDQNGEADDGLTFTSATVTDSIFNIVSIPGVPNDAVGGVNNQVAPNGEEGGFFDPNTFEREELRAILFNGAEVASSNGDGSLDVGTNGDFISNGAVHFQVTFQATPTQRGSREFTLDFGEMADLGLLAIGTGGAPIAGYNNLQHTFTVVPEPGTALLMGLGLLGLSTRRR